MEYSGYSNYHSLQTGINRRFDGGMMFSFFYVWSKTLGYYKYDGSAGLPNASDEEVCRLDCYIDTDCPHNFVAGTSCRSSRTATATSSSWATGRCRTPPWTSGRPQGVGFNIPGIGVRRMGSAGRTERTHRAHVRSGQRL